MRYNKSIGIGIKKKQKKRNPALARLILQTLGSACIGATVLCIFYFNTPLFDKYSGLVESNIKYHTDIIGAVQNILTYVHIL